MVELTEAQAAVYDRQLRVWGVETQKKWVILSYIFIDWQTRHVVFGPRSTVADSLQKSCFIVPCRLTSSSILIVGCSGLAAEARFEQYLVLLGGSLCCTK